MKRGKIHPEETMFLRVRVGTATGKNKNNYEMGTLAGDSSPIVKSEKTGKWFTLSWLNIVNMAVGAGIDK